VTATRTADASRVPLPRLLGRTCAAEWTRLWTVRTSWWFLLAAAVVLVGLGIVAGVESAGDPAQSSGDPVWTGVTVFVMPAQFALFGLALTAVTSDHATGGIVPTLQWTPRRGVLLLARAAVAVGTATAAGVVLVLASALAAHTAHPDLTLPVGEGADALGTVALVVAAGAALGVGLGFLLRSTAGALVAVFLLMLVLPLVLPQFGLAWATSVAEALPGSGAAYLLFGGEPAGMSRASSVTVLLAWAAGGLLLGWLRLARDDVR
jgi:ABC-2 type transport system permease protein